MMETQEVIVKPRVKFFCRAFFTVSLGLACWSLNKTVWAGDNDTEMYQRCHWEAKTGDSWEYRTEDGVVKVRDVSNTPYFCSLALYWEELKLAAFPRFPVLIVDIILWGFTVIACIVAAVGMCTKNHWMLAPLAIMLAIDIIAGIISVIIIFVYSYNSLIRIAIGIFFLGVNIFHVSLILVLVAMMQYIYDRKMGYIDAPPRVGCGKVTATPLEEDEEDLKAEKWVVTNGAAPYPTLPSNYAYDGSPQSRREGFYQPHPPTRQPSQAAYSTYDPRFH